MKNYIILLLIGVFVALGAALPFFTNELRDFRGGLVIDSIDDDGIAAPADQTLINQFDSSSSSHSPGWDSTPSDGGGDTNPTPPTDAPGGSPTPAVAADTPIKITTVSVGGITAGVILGLAIAVGIAVAVAFYIIKKKG